MQYYYDELRTQDRAIDSIVLAIDNGNAEKVCAPWAETSGEVFGHILLQFLDGASDGELSIDLKKKAVEIATVLGPDYGQTLYHLAVLVTKLA
jgi:hypothetical protein